MGICTGHLALLSLLTHTPMSTRFLLLALALPLAACGGDDAADTVDTTVTTVPSADPAVTNGEPMATTPGTAEGVTPGATTPAGSDVTVDGTIAAAGSDITAMSPTAAVANIDGWIAKLEGERFAPIRASLETLKLDLAAQPIDNAALGATLKSLGEQTTASAATASSSSQAGLQTLGGALSAAGAKLAGSTAM